MQPNSLRMNSPVKNSTRTPCKTQLKLNSAFLCGLLIGQAQAAEDISGLMDLSLDALINIPVITASRNTETRDQTPAHIMVITAEQIRSRRYKNLADLLADMPGVDFQRGTKTSQFNQFTINGNLGPNRLLVLIDGIPISQPAGGNYPVAENLSLHHAHQVEFLYGPAAALYGADAVSGVINIITSVNEGDRAWVSAGSGRFNSRAAEFGARFAPLDGFNILMGGHWQASDRAPLDKYYRDEYRKVDANFNGQVIIPAAEREKYRGEQSSHSFYLRADLEDFLSVGYYRNHYANLTSTVDPYATARYDRKARWLTTSDTFYGKLQFDLARDVSAQLIADYSVMEVDPRSNYNNVYNAFQPGYSYSRGERVSIEQNINWELSPHQQLQAGIGYLRMKATEAGSLPNKYDTGHGPGNQGMLYPNTTLPMNILSGSQHNTSAYAQLLSQWDERLSTTLGFRIDRHSSYGSALNPRLGVVWKPQDQHVLKVLYGKAFRAPSAEESLGSFGTFNGSQDAEGNYLGSAFRIPNLNLKPEKSETLGLVWEWRPTRNFNLISNLYHSRITDLIRTQPTPDSNFIPGAILASSDMKSNVGQQKQHGLDISAQWRFRLDRNWMGDLWASTGWVDGRIDEGDGVDWKLPYVARHKLKLGTSLRYRDRFSLTSRLHWVGSVSNDRKNPPNTDLGLPAASCKNNKKAPERCMTPGYVVLDLHFGWHRLLDRNLSLWLDIYNATDRRYYAAAGSGKLTFWDMPQQPRTWMLSLDWRY